jgi:glycolate oxidase FAD binding subunit
MARGSVGARMTTVSLDTTAAIRARVVDASNSGVALRIVGRGTWLDAGRPVRAAESISTEGLTGITEYVPGDLVLTARAGTTLGEIRAATAEHKQWLALDSYGGDNATIGAIVATGSNGPLLTSFGRPRDLVLGVEFVSGTGAIARGGGRVVKNVAGFDLTRLMCGSWGSLGIITEVTVRVHARPERDESLAIALDGNDAASRVRQVLRRLPFAPYACEVVNESLAQQLLGTADVTALIRLGGNREALEAQRKAFSELGDARAIDPAVWERLRTCEPASANVFRLSRLPSEIGDPWTAARHLADAFVHATPARGIVRCIVPRTSQSTLPSWPSSPKRVGERLTPELWEQFPLPASDIAARIKRAFDPRSVLNPGILGEPA